MLAIFSQVIHLWREHLLRQVDGPWRAQSPRSAPAICQEIGFVRFVFYYLESLELVNIY